MPNFTKEILLDNAKRSIVRFNYNGSGAAYGITSSVKATELAGYCGTASGVTNVDLSVSKIFWNVSSPSGQSVELSWEQTSSVSGQAFQYLTYNGEVDYGSKGISLKNTVTGTNRTNGIQIRNASIFSGDGSATIILELAKGVGYSITGITGP